MLKKCKYCGTLNLENAVNCSNCDRLLADSPIQRFSDSENFKEKPVSLEKKQNEQQKTSRKECEIKFSTDSNTETDAEYITKEKNKISESVEVDNTSSENEFEANIKEKNDRTKIAFKPLNWKKSTIVGIILGMTIVLGFPACNSKKNSNDNSSEAIAPEESVTVEPTEATEKEESVSKVYSAPTKLSEIPQGLKAEITSEFNDNLTAWAIFDSNDGKLVENAGIVGEYLAVAKYEERQYNNFYGVVYKLKYTSSIAETYVYTTYSISYLSVCGDDYEDIDLDKIRHNGFSYRAPDLTDFDISSYKADVLKFNYCFETVDELKKQILDAELSNFKYEYSELNS